MVLINPQRALQLTCREQPAKLPFPVAGCDNVGARTGTASASVARTARARASCFSRAFVLLLICLLLPFASPAQTLVKSIQGKVLDAGTTPLAGSILYLQDTKTNVIKTLIATEDGSYRFGQLPADTDYQVWAEYKGKKSKVRLVSSFDTKRDVTYNFHLTDK